MAKEAVTLDGKSFYWYDKAFVVELLIPYDANTENERNLQVEMNKQHLKVGIKGKEPIVDADLFDDVEEKGFTWNLKNGTVHVVIKKSEAFSFWLNLFKKNEPVECDK